MTFWTGPVHRQSNSPTHGWLINSLCSLADGTLEQPGTTTVSGLWVISVIFIVFSAFLLSFAFLYFPAVLSSIYLLLTTPDSVADAQKPIALTNPFLLA